MRLPTLSVIILSQAVIWGIAGAAIHGPMILLYPLSWAAIGAAFWFHAKRNPITSADQQTVTSSVKPSINGDAKTPTVESDDPHELATG